MSLRGYIRVKIMGENVTEFINICKKNSLTLYNIQRIMNVYFADVQSKHYKVFTQLAKENNIELDVMGKFGFFMKIILYKGRKAFFVALLTLLMYYTANYCFISEIELNGNNIYADKQIMECLENNGIYVGRLKFGINPEVFRDNFIDDFSGISWIWIKIDGTKAIVDVREKITKPEFFDYNAICNVVASKDGVITSAVSSSGTLLVHEGMYVHKGDILISGVYDSTDFAPVRFVNAGGNIYARTKYTIEDNFGCRFVSYNLNGEFKTLLRPKLFDIVLYDTKNTDNRLSFAENDIKFKIFGKNYLPLAFTKMKYCEIIRKEYTLSNEDARSYAVSELTRRLMLKLPRDASVINTEKNITQNPDGTFKASVSFECIEDIAQKLPIEVELD